MQSMLRLVLVSSDALISHYYIFLAKQDSKTLCANSTVTKHNVMFWACSVHLLCVYSALTSRDFPLLSIMLLTIRTEKM